MTTRCPIPGCDWVKPPDWLLCRNHWRMVPKSIRDRVWRAKRGSLDHLAASREAIAAITDRGPQPELAL